MLVQPHLKIGREEPSKDPFKGLMVSAIDFRNFSQLVLERLQTCRYFFFWMRFYRFMVEA